MRIRSNPIAKCLIVIVFLLTISSLHAQKFSTMPEKQRNEKLIEVAKSIFKHPRFKNSYREYGLPTIRIRNMDETKIANNPKDFGYGKDLGSLAYIVTFPYDKSKETMEWYDFATEVFISDKQGKAYFIQFGSGMGYNVWDIAKWDPNKKW